MCEQIQLERIDIPPEVLRTDHNNPLQSWADKDNFQTGFQDVVRFSFLKELI